MVSNFCVAVFLKPKVVSRNISAVWVFFFLWKVSWAKNGCFLAKILQKQSFRGNTPIFFYFFLTIFSKTWTKNARSTPASAPSSPVGCKASNSTKKPRFQWNHHRFQVLTQKNTWIPWLLVRVLLNTVKKSKKIWACFLWNSHLVIFGQFWPWIPVRY